MKKLSAMQTFAVMAAAGFLSFMLFINVNSAFAERHDIGWLYVVLGFAFLGAFVALVFNVIKKVNG